MRKILLVVIFAIGGLFAADHAHAQIGGQNQRMQEIRNMKIAFMAEAIGLTPEESQKFWPQYNQYWSERRTIGHRRRDLFKTIKDGQPSEAELKEYVSIMDADKRLVEKYIVEFKKILPVGKVAKVFVADENFKNQLLKMAAGGDRR